MPIYALTENIAFPSPNLAEEDGLLAIGGDLSPNRLLLAYQLGIFPWYNEEEPILWWSPNPRCVLYPAAIKISKSMKQLFKKQAFTVTFDNNFEQVVQQCQQRPRKGQDGTWITDYMLDAYCKLWELGFAHSVEVWNQEQELVGGLYGVSIGSCFFGESMFSKVSNASKYGFITLVRQLNQWGINLIDCQIHTKHLESLGAIEISRKEFLIELKQCIKLGTLQGKWTLNKQLNIL